MVLRLWFLLLLVLGFSTLAMAQTVPAAPTAQAAAAVTFPESSTIDPGTSVCETKRRQSLGEAAMILDPGDSLKSMTVTYNALPCPTTWLAQTTKAIGTAQLPKYISRLAFAIWFLGIIWTGIRLANGAEHSDGRELFARLLISGWVVLGSANFNALPSQPKFTGNMGEFVRAAWVEAYKWGDATFAAPSLVRAANETKNMGEKVSEVAVLYMELQIIGDAVGGAAKGLEMDMKVGDPGIGTVAGFLGGFGSGSVKAMVATTQAGIVAMNMSMPLLITYYLVIMGTGLATLLASLIVPLAGAMFIFSTGLGAQYLQTWFRTVASAVLMMAFMPIVFAGSMELGFIEPAHTFDVSMAKVGASLDKDMKQIEADYQKDGNFTEKTRRQIINRLQAAADKVDVGRYMANMLTAVVLMAFSLIAGVALLRTAQNWIIEFLGGVASAITNGGAPRMSMGGLGSSLSGAGRSASSAASGLKSSSPSGVPTSSGPGASSGSAQASVPKSAPSSSPSLASSGSSASASKSASPGLGSGGAVAGGSSNSGPSSSPGSRAGGASSAAPSAGSSAGTSSTAGASNNVVPTNGLGSRATSSGGTSSAAPAGSSASTSSTAGASNNIVPTNGLGSRTPVAKG